MNISNHCYYIEFLLSMVFILVNPIVGTSEETPQIHETMGPPAVDVKSEAKKKTILSLDQCLKLALARSKQIEAEKHRLDMINEKQEQLFWLPFSNFYLEGSFGILTDKRAIVTDGKIIGPSEDDWKNSSWGPSFHVKFGGSIPVPTSNRFFKAKEALEEAYKAKEAMLPTIKHRIAYDVHRAFHGVVGAREMLYTLSQGRKHLIKARQKVEENLEKQEGEDTQIDLLKIKAFESRLDVMKKQVVQIEKTALVALSFLVGADRNHPMELPEDPQDIVQRNIEDIDEYKATALRKRPEFAALRHGIKALKAKVSTAKGAFIPELAFSFRFSRGYTPGVEVVEQKRLYDENGNPILDENGNDTFASEFTDADTPFLLRNSYNYGSIIPRFGLVMRVPLDIGISIHKVREAKAELNALLADKTFAMEGVMLEVETSYIEVTSLLEIITALNKYKKIAKGWLNAATQNHAIGLGSTRELKDALKEYFTIMGELHQRIGEYNIAIAKLDKATGVILEK